MSSVRRRWAAASMMSVALFALSAFGTPLGASAAARIDIVATCTGNTLNGTVTVSGLATGTAVTVRAEVLTTGWATVGAPVTFVVVAGRTIYPLSTNVAGTPGAKAFRLVATNVSGLSAASDQVKADSCGPPVQVPEVPAPLVIPATMLLTAGVFEALRRRRLAGQGT